MSLGDLCEREILEHLFKGSGVTMRPELWIGLSSGEPLEDGSDKKELSGGGYGRKKYLGSTIFGSAVSGQITNSSTISLPYATSEWTAATHFFISSTGIAGEIGNTLLLTNSLNVSKTVEGNDLPQFQTGELVIQLD